VGRSGPEAKAEANAIPVLTEVSQVPATEAAAAPTICDNNKQTIFFFNLKL
jgi:hypothetical protein